MRLFAYFFIFTFSIHCFGQSLLFRELFRKSDKAQFDFSYSDTTSHWQNPYGRQSKFKTSASSAPVEKDSSRFKIQASYENLKFENSLGFGQDLENPAFSALWDFEGLDKRFLSEVSVLSPSDQPYHSLRETSVNATWAAAPLKDLTERDTSFWLWFVNFSSTRSFLPNIPLPGFSYVINTAGGWNYSLGLPFVTATYFSPKTFTSQITVGPYFYSASVGYGPPFFKGSLFTSWRQESFYIAERDDTLERLFMDQKEVGTSLKHPLTKQVLVEWSLKYVFDKKHFYGRSYSKKTQSSEEVGSSVDLMAHLIFSQ